MASKTDVSGGCLKEIAKKNSNGETAMKNLTTIMKDNDIST